MVVAVVVVVVVLVIVIIVVVVVGVPPPRAYILLKMVYNGKGVGGWGGGSSVLRKLIREATTRGMCVLESIRIIALGVFGQ